MSLQLTTGFPPSRDPASIQRTPVCCGTVNLYLYAVYFAMQLRLACMVALGQSAFDVCVTYQCHMVMLPEPCALPTAAQEGQSGRWESPLAPVTPSFALTTATSATPGSVPAPRWVGGTGAKDPSIGVYVIHRPQCDWRAPANEPGTCALYVEACNWRANAATTRCLCCYFTTPPGHTQSWTLPLHSTPVSFCLSCHCVSACYFATPPGHQPSWTLPPPLRST
jgi:hypothetical protein